MLLWLSLIFVGFKECENDVVRTVRLSISTKQFIEFQLMAEIPRCYLPAPESGSVETEQ